MLTAREDIVLFLMYVLFLFFRFLNYSLHAILFCTRFTCTAEWLDSQTLQSVLVHSFILMGFILLGSDDISKKNIKATYLNILIQTICKYLEEKR